jgi:hypothetical protein
LPAAIAAPPLQHTWNAGALDAATGCQQSTDYASAANLNANRADGIRDTPPQLPAKFATAAKSQGDSIFFNCNADGSFDPAAAGMKDQPLSCAAGGNLYFNNFYNTMSYFGPDCATARRTPSARQTTLTPGQIARMRSERRCCRMDECFKGGVGGGGTFPF